MPEAAAAVVTAAVEQTPLAKEIQAKTQAAVIKVGFGPEMDAEFDAAIKKDNEASKGKTGEPAGTTAETGDRPVGGGQGGGKDKPAAAGADTVPDIPDGAIKTATEKTSEQEQAEREKFLAEQTKGMSPKAADRFKSIEKRAHEAEARAAKLVKVEAEAAQWRAKAEAPNGEIGKLKEELAQMDELVRQTNLIAHPKFKAAFEAPIAAKIDELKAMVGTKGPELIELLDIPAGKFRSEQLSELMGEMDQDFDKLNLVGAIRELDVLKKARAAELSNWKENSSRLAETEKKKSEEVAGRRKAEVESAINAALSRFTDPEHGFELYREVEGQEEWNKKVKERIATVRNVSSADLTPQDISEMAAAAIAAPEYRKLFLAQRALVGKLKAQLKDLNGAGPTIPAAGDINPKNFDSKETWVNAVIKQAEKDGLLR
jgi:hypothetical protein